LRGRQRPESSKGKTEIKEVGTRPEEVEPRKEFSMTYGEEIGKTGREAL